MARRKGEGLAVMSAKSKRSSGEHAPGPAALSQAIEDSCRAVVITDSTGGIQYANPRFCELMGYRRSELSRMSIFELTARPRQEELMMWNVINAGGIWQGRVPGRRKDGQQVWATALVTAVHDAKGKVSSFLAAFDEIAEPQWPELDLGDQPQFPADVPPDVVMMTDVNGTILYVSRTVPGISREQATGASLFNFVPIDHHARLRWYMDRVVLTKEPITYEIPGIGPRGTTDYYLSQVGPIQRDGEVVALSFITIDLSRRTVERPAAELAAGPPDPAKADLSQRESEVLELLAQGLTNRQVAECLRVSLRTIDHHVSHILSKLSVPNRTAAAMAARRTGLLQ